MTVGQRIARKRKELGLSQEALGERLGVSRQAIYKWESDAALPEIEKLVNLSREFSVSVGWLLGEEDDAPEKPELTPEQLRMVEEIVGRYLAARPAQNTVILRETVEAEPGDGKVQAQEPEKPKKRRRWPWVLAALALVGVFFNLFSRLDQVSREYQNLQNSINYITTSVHSQIDGITYRVESILESQNRLTAEQSAEVTATDYRANTVTVSARALPRTYVEGMTADFILVSDGETLTVPGTLGTDHAFTAELTGPLSDGVSVSVAFLAGDQRETQLLDQFTYLYSGSFPNIYLFGGRTQASKSSEATTWTAFYDPVDVDCTDQNGGPAAVSSLRVGLFRDQKLVWWFVEEPDGANHQDGSYTFRPERENVLLEPGHTYFVAAVVKDEFGRECVVPDQRGGDTVTEAGELEQVWDWVPSYDPADWDY